MKHKKWNKSKRKHQSVIEPRNFTHRRIALEGVISVSAKGTGYVKIPDKKEDIEIDFQDLNTALHGDLVEIIPHPKKHGRQTAEVFKILTRAKIRFVGVLETENKMFFLKPDDVKMYTDILIPEKFLNNAKVGQKVFVEIISWNNPRKMPEGKVINILGKPGENDTEMHSIAIEKGFAASLPNKVEEEAKRIREKGISKNDFIGRKDFRKTLTFTIDPADAKDFDDAISFKVLNDREYEVGIHIADVSHYVRTGSALDAEAKERGTSVYLVDRTIPMLPEILSNDLCSLVPNKDRLTMSAVFVLTQDAKVKDAWFGRTIIHSQKRFTYEEAEESIKKSSKPLHKELSTLNNLAKKLTKERFARGAMSLEQEEVKFVLTDTGVPIRVIKKERGDSNKLIEEFMLLANKKVAELLSPKKTKGTNDETISIYRVHDLPNKEKMADLASFLQSLGYKMPMQNGIIPAGEINKLLENLSKKNTSETILDTVQRAVVRSMAKAIYSTKNIGHYGLAFEYYTHFTSPIRRYPDILVHRLLADHLIGKKIGKEKLGEYEKMAFISSEQEKRASDAERASIKYKQVEYMSTRLGKNFEGIISGMTEWGMYVEEIETKCEGLVRLRDMDDDFYVFDEKRLEMVGQKKKKKYRFGNRVKIKVKTVDLEKKTIDYVLV